MLRRVPSADTLELPKSVVLVGLMGAGKSAVGKRLATRLGLPFVDADNEIEAAAGRTIEEIFQEEGEAAFRRGERKVMARLLRDTPVHVLATGGGAFMDPETRALIKERAVSVWLRADLDILVARTARKNHRPLLRWGDPRAILGDLIERRHPIYAEADLTVVSDERPPEATVDEVLFALDGWFGAPIVGPTRGGRARDDR